MKKTAILGSILVTMILSCMQQGPRQNTQIKYNGISIRFQLNEKSWIIQSKKIEPTVAFVVYSGPDMTSEKFNKLVNPTIGIVIEKVGPKADPEIYFTLKRKFAGLTGNLISMYSKKDEFLKIPRGIGCLGKLENPEGIILNRMLITTVFKEYGIMIICDTVEDTYPEIEKELKNVIRSMTFH